MDNAVDSRLTEIFSTLNLSDFPVLKEHAKALKKMVAAPRTTMQEMVELCQRDYGLTVKVLREANSDFYSHTRSVTAVNTAAGRIGFDSIKDQVAGLSQMEDVAGMVGEGEIMPLVARSFLSASLCRAIVKEKRLPVPPDDAFVCGLLHKMGRVAALIFLSERYRRVRTLEADGHDEDAAARQVFYGLSYAELGMEVARFWNFPDLLISAMEPAPPPPRGRNDPEGIMQNLVSLSNRLVDAVCEGGGTNILFDEYGEYLSLNKEEALKLLEACVGETKGFAKAYKQKLLGYKITGKIKRMESVISGSIRAKRTVGIAQQERKEQPTQGTDPVKVFFDKVNRALKERRPFKEISTMLLEALQKGVGLDRALLASLDTTEEGMFLQGRFGVGDIMQQEIRGFHYDLSDPGDAITNCLAMREDSSLIIDNLSPLTKEVRNLMFGRFLYLMPLFSQGAPLGLLLLDRKPGRLPLSKAQMSAASALRDLFILGIRTDSQGFFNG